MTAWVYVNGEIVEEAEAKVAALDRGLLHGRGLFETMRSYGGVVFRLEEHLQRLADGMKVVGIGNAPEEGEIRRGIAALLERNGLREARLRLTVTAGPSAETDKMRSTVVIAAEPLGAQYPDELYERGMSAVMSDVRRNETSLLSRVKSLNCLDSVLAREQAKRQGADEALLLNCRGMVAEGSASNLFVVGEEGLTTPSIESGALPGITRAAIIEIATEAGTACRESNVALDDLPTAKEAFLTGSIMGVMPLTRLDGSAIGDGRPGPATELMRRLHRRLVERETGGRNAGGRA